MAFGPWWPHAEAVQGCGAQVTDAFGKVDSKLAKIFDEAVSNGDVGRTARLMQASKDLDTAFSVFKVGGTVVGGLHARLIEVSEAVDAGKHLGEIETQIENASLTHMDKPSELDFASVSKALEALELLWKSAQKSEPVSSRLAAASRSLAVCVETLARDADVAG